MNVTMEKVGNVDGLITVSLEANDYQDKVKKELKEFSRRRPEKGFRPGFVPMGLLQKKYGKEALVEVINRESYEALVGYIRDNKLNILGDPMLSNAEELKFEDGNDFVLKFEVGIAPEINYVLDQNTEIPYYNIEVDQEMIDRNDKALLKRYGKQVAGEEVDETALVKGAMVELNEDGSAKDGGVTVENTIVSPQHFSDEEQKGLFAGKKVGEEVVFNPWKTCNGNAAELASMLNKEKEEVAEMKSDFKMTIKEIAYKMGYSDSSHLVKSFQNIYGISPLRYRQEYSHNINLK